MNVKQTLFLKICAILVIISLVISDFLFVGTSLISYAIDWASTNSENVEFVAYFLDGNGQKADKISRSIDEKNLKLYVEVSVKNNDGYFNGKITLNNGNFNLKQENNSQYINSISGNTITLNQINAGSNVTLELGIEPVYTSAILNTKTDVVLNGNYVNSKNAEKQKYSETTGKATVELNWESSYKTGAELGVILLSNSLYKIDNVEKRVVQVLIKSKIRDNNYPVKSTQIEVSVPENVEDIKVHSRSTMATNSNIIFGENNYMYSKDKKLLTIDLSNEEQNSISWCRNVQDEMVVTYIFDKQENVSDKEILAKSKIETYDNQTLTAKIDVHIDKQIDGIVSNTIETEEDAIYKGKLYTGQERQYKVKDAVNIDFIDDKTLLTVKENKSAFISGNTEPLANAIYKETKINKQEFLKIFGEDGYIAIKNQTGVVVSNINKDSKIDESGNIVLTYSVPTTSLEITTSKPTDVGTLNIEHTKAILNENISRDVVEQFTAIKEVYEVNGSKTEKTIALNETDSVVSLKIKNLSKISTIADSQKLELEAILQASDESKDLYKNPKITITLPDEIKITAFDVNALNVNGLKIDKEKTSIIDSNKLLIVLNGEQKIYDGTEGTILTVTLDIKTDKLTPSKMSKVQMRYTNENKKVEKDNTCDIELESQYGLMIYNKFSNYNNAKETLITLNSEEKLGSIDVNSTAKQFVYGTALINNYGQTISNVVLIGTIPAGENEGSYKARLNKVEVDNADAKVYYSVKPNAEADDDSWGDYTENAISYKVELPEMVKEQVVKIKVTLTIQENIGYNKTGKFVTKTSCIFQGIEQKNSSSVILSTNANIAEEAPIEEKTSQDTEVEFIKTSTVSGNNILKENDCIFSGQTLKYKVIVTNNTGMDYTNVTIKAKQNNGYVWDYVEEETYNPHFKTSSKRMFYEVTDSNDMELGKLENFKNGESYTFEYEAVAYKGEKQEDNYETFGTIYVDSGDKKLSKTQTTIKNKIKDEELQVRLYHGYDKDMYLTSGGDIKTQLAIQNTTNETLKDIEVKVAFSNNLEGSVCLNQDNEQNVTVLDQFAGENGIKIVTLKILNLAANSTENVEIYSYTDNSLKNNEEEVWILAQAITSNNNSYLSNKFVRKVYDNTHNIELKQQSFFTNGGEIDTNYKLNDGDKIQLIATVTNKEEKPIDVDIEYKLDNMIDIESAKIITTDGEEDVTQNISFNQLKQSNKTMKAGETVRIAMLGKIDALDIEEVSNELNVYDNANGKTDNNSLSIPVNTKHQQIIKPLEEEEKQTPEETKPNVTPEDNGTNNENTTDSQKPTESKDIKTYTISGTVWKDSDKDGRKASTEEKLRDITVEAINLDKGKVLASVKTGSNGEYTLSLEEGKYVLIFDYNNEIYTTTTYKGKGIDETEDSDAIERNIKLGDTTKKAAITDTITLNSNITNIDIGLVLRSVFDLKTEKYVSKITVTNNAGTKIYEQPKNTTLAKAEIKAKNLSGSLVVIEYKIKVTNVGDVAGYAKNIVDHIPTSLSFNSSMNSDWYLSGENLYNTSIANTKIDPGESKELTLVLTKTMTETNTGLINNKAEIKESSNLLGIKDEKNDIGSADIIISVSTGTIVSYVISTIITFIIIAGIAYVINKKYLSRRI